MIESCSNGSIHTRHSYLNFSQIEHFSVCSTLPHTDTQSIYRMKILPAMVASRTTLPVIINAPRLPSHWWWLPWPVTDEIDSLGLLHICNDCTKTSLVLMLCPSQRLHGMQLMPAVSWHMTASWLFSVLLSNCWELSNIEHCGYTVVQLVSLNSSTACAPSKLQQGVSSNDNNGCANINSICTMLTLYYRVWVVAEVWDVAWSALSSPTEPELTIWSDTLTPSSKCIHDALHKRYQEAQRSANRQRHQGSTWGILHHPTNNKMSCQTPKESLHPNRLILATHGCPSAPSNID